MSILIVTPTLGRSPWLSDTVASVAAFPALHHVLVAPAGEVAGLAARFPGTTVVAEEAGAGMYAAINVGARVEMPWTWIGYLNDDDLLLARFAAVKRAAETAAPDTQVVYGGVRLIDAQGRRLGGIPVSPRPALNRALYANRLEPVYQHGTLLRRNLWEALGGCDARLRFCGDSDLLARACLHGAGFQRVRGEIGAFRLHEGQLTKNRAAMIGERATVDYHLGLTKGVSGSSRHWARCWFRLANAPIYAERILRHGFLSFDDLLVRAG